MTNIGIQLFNGDCIELMKNIPDESVDMVLCDLPYGTTQCKWDSIIPFDKLWEAYNRIIKPNGVIALFADEPFSAILVVSNLKMYRYELIWEKEQGTDFLNANRKPLKRHEKIQIFYKAQPTYNKQLEGGRPYKAVNGNKDTSVWGSFKMGMNTDNEGTRNPTTILKFNRERGLHPTQKPVPLLEWLIRTYTNEGEAVLDNCMGSGSTGVACIHTNRNFIGMELDKNYFDIATKRIKEESGLCETKERLTGLTKAS